MNDPNVNLAAGRAAIARAAKAARNNQSGDSAKDKLAALRAEYAEKKLENYIKEVVAVAPPLSAEQRERLAELIHPHDHRQFGGSRSEAEGSDYAASPVPAGRQ